MSTQVLATELETDPLGRGYAGMTSAAAAASLNTVNRTRAVTAVDGSTIFEATVPAEYNVLLPDQKSLFLAIVGMSSVRIVTGSNSRAALLAMFGAGTTTRTNLAALQTEPVSRADEIGFGFVHEGDVIRARGF